MLAADDAPVAGRQAFIGGAWCDGSTGATFGGTKDSGFGLEGPPKTLHEFLRSKNIRFATDGPVPVWETAERVLS